jgi:hypothetical protein
MYQRKDFFTSDICLLFLNMSCRACGICIRMIISLKKQYIKVILQSLLNIVFLCKHNNIFTAFKLSENLKMKAFKDSEGSLGNNALLPSLQHDRQCPIRANFCRDLLLYVT